ncbi:MULTISPECIES: hypothetical protein [Xenorhabdus]|uniref:hypothetical protein n=1 Tax=Xenorhabdus TaxID=626 RepID=UPI00064B3CA1|nr:MULTISPECIES: hypothetical protein [Xenorhabdus]KLU13979.1 hypothetical protein AAY47_19070 [Xenorhabdus griffiniae]KOP31927.1 hypothetical protein AFK69_18210 [Xenorhabdus sp. GDc328]
MSEDISIAFRDPHNTAYRVLIELIRAGAFNEVQDKGKDVVSTFNTLLDHFEKLESDGTNSQ